MTGPDTRAPSRESARRCARAFAGASAAFAVAFTVVLLTVVSAPGGVTGFDRSVGGGLHDVAADNPWLVEICLILEFVGGVGFSVATVTAVVIVLLVLGGRRRPFPRTTYAALFLALSAAGGTLVNTVVKDAVQRERPPWNGLWSYQGSWSFPSGHAEAGITVWVALGLVAVVLVPGRSRWLIGVPLLVLGPLIGLSRSVLGVHWPTDVLGGWTLGATWLCVCAAATCGLWLRSGASAAPEQAEADAAVAGEHDGSDRDPGHDGEAGPDEGTGDRNEPGQREQP